MKIDLTKESPNVKQKLLEILIPNYAEKEISEMTSLAASTIGYYRRTYKIPTYHSKKKSYEAEAMKQVSDTLKHNREYAIQRAYEVCADYGINDNDA